MMKCLYFIFIFCSWTGTFFIIITTAINVVPLLGCERNSRVQFRKAICNLCNISLYCETNYYQLHICTHFGKSCSWLSVYCANFLADCPTLLCIFLVDFKVFFVSCSIWHITELENWRNCLNIFLNQNPFPPWLIRWFCPDFTAIVSLIWAMTVLCQRKIGLGN